MKHQKSLEIHVQQDGLFLDEKINKTINDTKGTFQAKMGSINNRNSIDQTEAEGIKKRWKEYTEELYKKCLNDPDNYRGPAPADPGDSKGRQRRRPIYLFIYSEI